MRAAARAVFVLACAAALSARPRRKSKVGSRRPAPSGAPQQKKPPPFDAAMLCQAQTANEAAESLLVPERCRGAPCEKTWYEFVALDDLFAGTGIGEAYDESASFREALRRAARDDRVAEDSPVRFDLAASAQGSWRGGASPALSAALRDVLGAGAPSGEAFLEAIGGLELDGVAPATGHFIEIVGGPGATKVARHAWHQDRAGDERAVTAMLGFPASDRYEGCGVFSHVAALSHLVVTEEEETISSPREFYPAAKYLDVDDVPEASIVRPSYGRGREILLYSDARNIHTSPDIVHRDCLWRFM